MKYLKHILVALLLICVFSISVSAESPTTVTVESVSAMPGETVTVSVILENCGPVKSMAITPQYDETVLELQSGRWTLTDGLLFENWTPEKGDAVFAYPDAKDINGTIFELSFKVKEDAQMGTTTSVSCDIILRDGKYDYENTVIDGVFTITAPESRFSSASVQLDTDITVNYLVDLDDAHIGAQVRFTMNGIEQVVDGTPTGNGNEYLFPFRGVAPQCMGDNIKAELILDGKVIVVKDTYSVKAYCEKMMSKSAADLELNDGQYAALQTLIKDMLVYGAKAQLYRGYKTDALVDEGITGSEFIELTETAKVVEPSECEGVEIVALGVYFDYTNSIYIRFTAPGMTDDNFYIMYTDAANEDNTKEFLLSDCTPVEGTEDMYILILDPVSATNYSDEWYIDLYAKPGRKWLTQLATYSIDSYIYSMQNRTTDGTTLSPMAHLARATYNYGKSTAAYAAALK